AFKKLVGIPLHEDAVVERTGLTLVGIDAEVNGTGVILGQESPLEPAWESGAAAPAQPGGLYNIDDLGGCHFVEGFGKSAIATVAAVRLEGGVGLVQDATQKNRFEMG